MNKFELYCYLVCIAIMVMYINSITLVLSGIISLCLIVFMDKNYIECFLLCCSLIICGVIKSYFENKKITNMFLD